MEKCVYGLLILSGFLADDSAVIIPSPETGRSPHPASNSGKREQSEDVRKRQENLIGQGPAHRLK